MPTTADGPAGGKGILSSHHIALAGAHFGPLKYSPADVQRFITNAGGIYLPKLTSTCTILLASEKAWQTKAPPVVTALMKHRDKVAVVTWDWLEDCVMKSKRCLQTKKYLWRKPEKRRKVGVLGEWRRLEKRAPEGGLEEEGRKLEIEGELRKGRYHIYNDKGIEYDMSLTRGDAGGVLVERYRLCLHTNDTTFKTKVIYATTFKYTSTTKIANSEFPITKSTKPEYLAEPGSNWATAYAALELFFQGKTKIALHDVLDRGCRVVSNGWVIKAKGLAKRMEQIGSEVEMFEREDGQGMYEEDEDVEGVLGDYEDEAAGRLDDTGTLKDEDQQSWEDETMEDEKAENEDQIAQPESEMEIGNALTQQIETEEAEMDSTPLLPQSTIASRAEPTTTSTGLDDSDTDISLPPASELDEIEAETKKASAPAFETKYQKDEIEVMTPSAPRAIRSQKKSAAKNTSKSKRKASTKTTLLSKTKAGAKSIATTKKQPVAKSKAPAATARNTKRTPMRRRKMCDDSDDDSGDEYCDPADGDYQP